MKNRKLYTVGFLIAILIIVVVDLVVKWLIVNTLRNHEEVEIIPGFFSIIRIHTVKMAFGLRGGYWMIDMVRFAFHAVMLFFTIRIQKRNVHQLYKYSTVMIVCGWLGNYSDRFLLALGDTSYIQMDYLYVHAAGFVFNLCTVVISVGWILLIVSIIVRFNDLKVIFSKERSLFA